MSIQHNLANVDLTDSDIADLLCLLTKRCGAKTCRRVESGLRYGKDQIAYWAQQRLIKESYGWTYCAGQDYPSEIASIRKMFN